MVSRKENSNYIHQLRSSFLPTNHEVLSRFFHYHTTYKNTIRESSYKTSKEVIGIWEKFNVSTITLLAVTKKITVLHKKWTSLKKNIRRKSVTQVNKETAFKAYLKKLFDISCKSAIIDPISKQFLDDQRAERGLMIKPFI